MSKVYIVLVNWNGWKDTIECLESVFKNDYGNYRVVVVDNGSSDDSLALIKQWAAGNVSASINNSSRLRYLAEPPLSKPIRYVEYDRGTGEQGGSVTDEPPLTLISSGANLGFAGGNNIALRYALARGDFAYVWLLNNDTIIEPEALSALVRRMEDCPGAGMCGSMLPYYDRPDVIWAQGGGSLNRFIAQSHCIGNGLLRDRAVSHDEVETQMDYVAGASLLVSRPFVDAVGLMSEDYFLYFEEPDWSFRGKGRFTLTYAPESVVYHKVGMSTNAMDRSSSLSASTPDYVFRNQLLFTWKFFPWFIPATFLWALIRQLPLRAAQLIRFCKSIII